MVDVKEFYDEQTGTLTYLVFDLATKDAVVIDPIWNFNQETGEFNEHSHKEVLRFLNSKDLKLSYILETHAHADHITGRN